MAIPDLDQLLREGVRGRRVFLRVDLNVPLERGRIRDDTRIRRSVPTLRRLIEGGAQVIATSHLGRPKGQRVAELSLRPVAPRLAELLGCGVSFCVGRVAGAAGVLVAESADLAGVFVGGSLARAFFAASASSSGVEMRPSSS